MQSDGLGFTSELAISMAVSITPWRTWCCEMRNKFFVLSVL